MENHLKKHEYFLVQVDKHGSCATKYVSCIGNKVSDIVLFFHHKSYILFTGKSLNFRKKNNRRNDKEIVNIDKNNKEIMLTFDGIPIRKLYVTNLTPEVTCINVMENVISYSVFYVCVLTYLLL